MLGKNLIKKKNYFTRGDGVLKRNNIPFNGINSDEKIKIHYGY